MSLPSYPPPPHLAGAPSAPASGYDADVVILSMDRARETVEAIASARAQTGLSKHVWIADQGSDPGNLAVLMAAVGNAPDATLVQLDRNWGVAGGRNRAPTVAEPNAHPGHRQTGGRFTQASPRSARRRPYSNSGRM